MDSHGPAFDAALREVASDRALHRALHALRCARTLPAHALGLQLPTTRGATLELAEAAATSARAGAEAVRAAITVAEADIRSAKPQLDAVALDLARAEAAAPARAIALSRAARVGSTATGAAPLLTLARDGVIELEAQAIETDLGRIAPGYPARVTLPAGKATGTVRRVAPAVGAAMRLGAVRVALEPDVPRPPADAFARAVIEVGRAEAGTVPLGAILTGDAGDAVAVALAAPGGTAMTERRAVETGAVTDGRIEILSGLEPGETVLAPAGAFCRDGATPVPLREGPADGEAPRAEVAAPSGEDDGRARPTPPHPRTSLPPALPGRSWASTPASRPGRSATRCR